ncbi:MAG TPA: nitroreductase/quinone reductase family protein [Candidatus Dormibacteraeota bacterium]|nr:nitroreductase/quinone reductase family protein [Candidatus Dormibacteraeota bacterium]
MKAFNERVIAEFRTNQGQFSGNLEGRQLMVLTTTGRKTGLPKAVVIGYRRDGDRYLAIASNNGNDSAPHWYFNLRANPIAVAEVGPDKFEVRASVADREERKRLLNLIDYLPNQQALTKREIPIVIFERIQQ